MSSMQPQQSEHYNTATPRLDRAMVYFLISIPFIAPIPLGSNRPIFWAIWAFVISSALLIILANISFNRIMTAMDGLWHVLICAAILPLYGIIQIIPFDTSILNLANALPSSLHTDTISIAPTATALAVIRQTTYLILFVITVIVVNRTSTAKLILQGILVAITAHAIYGTLQVAGIPPSFIVSNVSMENMVATGTFINRNSFASFLGMGIIVGLSLFFAGSEYKKNTNLFSLRILSPNNQLRLGYITCCCIIMLALILTLSRAGLFASLSGAIVCIAVWLNKKRKDSKNKDQNSAETKIYIFVFIIMLAIVSFMLTAVAERAIFTVADSNDRIEIYRTTIENILSRPFFGYGLDSFEVATEQSSIEATVKNFIFTDAHSTYLENWQDAGLLFGSSFLIAAILLIISVYGKGRPKSIDTCGRSVFFGIFAVASTHSLVDFSFEIAANAYTFSILLAVSASSAYRSR